jgi:hypothetical protein
MIIDDAGSVGIGTTTPARKLQVSGTGNRVALFENTAGSVSDLAFGNTTGGGLLGYSGGDFYVNVGGDPAVGTGGAEAMRIDSSGNVGIGTTAPQARLTVRHSAPTLATPDHSVFLQFDASAEYNGIRIQGAVQSDLYVGRPAGAIDALIFGRCNQATDEWMRIDNSGNLLVGRTTAIGGGRLTVQNTGVAASFYRQSVGANTMIFFQSDDGGVNSTVAVIRCNGTTDLVPDALPAAQAEIATLQSQVAALTAAATLNGWVL